VAECCGEFLAAWSAIERYGIDGWMLLAGERRPSARLGEALDLFAGELNRLELEDDVADAIRQAGERR
jgi:hypothetical protein